MISAAMFVKNEERHLERCLKSIKPIVDEIIIVDTGSTDRTVEIAKQFTDKIYHEPWRDDFGWHRQHSFSLCTHPWILQIDADEEFFFTGTMTVDRFRANLSKVPEGIDSIGLEIEDYRASKNAIVARFDVLRLFRNGSVTWSRRVHNHPSCKGKSILFKDGRLRHHGYDLTDEHKKAKAERTIGLLTKMLAEDPQDYESMFYIAQAYASFADDQDNALKWALQYAGHRDETDKNFNTSVYHLIAVIYSRKKMEDECLRWIKAGLDHDSCDIDLLMDLIQHSLRTNNSTQLATAAQRFVLVYDNFEEYRFKHPGKFYFTYNPVSYSSALFYASVCMLENGTAIYRRLKTILDQLPAVAKDEINTKLAMAFERISLTDSKTSFSVNQSSFNTGTVPQNLEIPELCHEGRRHYCRA